MKSANAWLTRSKFLWKMGCVCVWKVSVASGSPIGRVPMCTLRKSSASRRNSVSVSSFLRMLAWSANDSSSPTTGSSFQMPPMRSLHQARSLATITVCRGSERSREALPVSPSDSSGTM